MNGMYKQVSGIVRNLYTPDRDLRLGLFASDSTSFEDSGGLFPRIPLILSG